MLVGDGLALVGDIGLLTADNEEASLLDLGFHLERASFAQAAIQFFLDLLEQGFERREILAFLAVCDFIGGLFLGC